AALVVAHQLADPRHLLDPGLPRRRQQVELDVRQPVGGLDNRHAATGARIGDARAVGTDAEAQLLGDGHVGSGAGGWKAAASRRRPTAAAARRRRYGSVRSGLPAGASTPTRESSRLESSPPPGARSTRPSSGFNRPGALRAAPTAPAA